MFFRSKEKRPPSILEAEPTAEVGIATGNPVPTAWSAYVKRVEAENGRKGVLIGILMGGLAASIGVNVMVAKRLSQPDVRLVRFGDAGDRTYVLHPGQIQGTDREMLIKSALQDYVVKRETIDHVTENERDNWLRLYTEPNWWKVYQEFISPNNPQNPRAVFARKLLTREIQVLFVTPSPGQSAYQVFFLTIDRRDKQIVAKQEWVATMSVFTRGLVFQGQEYAANPLGVTIANYAIQSRYGEDARQ